MVLRETGYLVLATLLCVYVASCLRHPSFVVPVKMVAGGSYTIAMTRLGDVYSWGADHRGNLGRGIRDHLHGPQQRPEPALVRLPSPAAEIFAGADTAFAITLDGAVHGWGANSRGELGDGTFTDQPSPVRVALDDPIAQIAAGVEFTAAITRSGFLYTWGSNEFGALGDGLAKDRAIPALLDVGEPVRKVAAVGRHCLALTESGKVLAWGSNGCGQVGDLDLNTSKPTTVPLPGRANDIAAGLAFSLALTEGGEVFSWGTNIYGLLGNGGAEDSARPVRVAISDEVVAIASGWSHVFALSAAGTLYGWGWNEFGQVGIGIASDHVPVPTRVILDPVPLTSTISVGDAHTLFVCPDGTIFGWGGNTIGQLGDGTRTRRYSPVRLPPLTIK